MIIVVDSDGLIANLNLSDAHHLSAQKITHLLVQEGARLIYPATTIVETVTLLQGRLNSPEIASQIIQLVNNNLVNIANVDNEILQKASLLMDLKTSKHNTFFDAVVAVIAEKYQADAIFSFDKFYTKKGFKLASEL